MDNLCYVNENVNESERVNNLRQMTSDNSLPHHSSVGGYPIYYLDEHINVLCPICANQNESFSNMLIEGEINWEDDSLFCDHCSTPIECAYE